MKRMKEFEFERAQSTEEAAGLLKANTDSVLIAGGTDLLGTLKEEILPENPKLLVDIKTIADLKGIQVTEDALEIGALTTLTEIAESPEVLGLAPMVAEAAGKVATPLVRNLGTLGGNLCQDVRCWFYRYPEEGGGKLLCRRKCGEECYALQGDNRYHSVYGGVKMGCTECTKACPAGTDIPGYMEQIRLGNWPGAAQILMQVNPMPVVTSRVCAHFCMDHCNHSSHGDSVQIRTVERTVGEFIEQNSAEFYQAPQKETGKRVAVIGAGPSGLSAAFYLRLNGIAVDVYDAKKEPGGMLMYAIPAYRLPKAKVRKLIDSYKNMGIRFICSTVVGKDITPAQLEEQYDAVYYATGTWKRPVLGLAGEDLTVFGLDFLVEVEKWMNGKVGKEVLVTGGGNVAMDVAITAKRLGAKRVVLACLESEEEMPASRAEIARAREEGIEILPGWGLSRVLQENGTVHGMELKRCLNVKDAAGRFNPQYDEKDLKSVSAENILMAVGQKVDLSFLDEKYQLQLNKRGLIDVDEETMKTSREKVFAGGDATTGPSTVIQCIANGHKAANGICSYLGIEPGHACVGKQIRKEFLTYDVEGIKKAKGLSVQEAAAASRNLTDEDEICPSREAGALEATRCMNCGCYAVAPSDLEPALIAAGAVLVTTERELKAAEFASKAKPTDILHAGEIITKVRIPLIKGAVMHYDKFRLRESVDWAISSLASVIAAENGKIQRAVLVLGGVAPVPVRLHEVEGFLVGKEISKETIDAAVKLAVKDAMPMSGNSYKLNAIDGLLSDALSRVK